MMSTLVRKRIPPSLHGTLRRGYVGLGVATAPLRLRPSFLMVGASRAGTTSLFRALSEHPQVFRPAVNKGVRYFDLNFARGRAWYDGHFPLRATAAAATPQGTTPVAFEASGYYLYHPLAPQRIADQLAGVKVVAMLRDPVERAFSAWKHETARGFEWEPFERSLDLEEERLRGEVHRMELDPTYESFCHRHHSHRSRGEYADQLERYLACLPQEDVHVILSEDFFRKPAETYAELLAFLGLAAYEPARFDQHNARPSEPMPADTRRRLEHHFAPHNERLERLLHRPLPWS